MREIAATTLKYDTPAIGGKCRRSTLVWFIGSLGMPAYIATAYVYAISSGHEGLLLIGALLGPLISLIFFTGNVVDWFRYKRRLSMAGASISVLTIAGSVALILMVIRAIVNYRDC